AHAPGSNIGQNAGDFFVFSLEREEFRHSSPTLNYRLRPAPGQARNGRPEAIEGNDLGVFPTGADLAVRGSGRHPKTSTNQEEFLRQENYGHENRTFVSCRSIFSV